MAGQCELSSRHWLSSSFALSIGAVIKMSRLFNAINHSRHHLIALGLYVIFFVLFFSPVIIRNHILAPGDGANFYYPAFKRRLFTLV